MRNRAHMTYRSMAGDSSAAGAAAGSPATVSRDEAVMAEMNQVYLIAARIHERLPASVQLEDLVSAGIIGLLEAWDNYKPGRDAQFRTFARFRIRGAILDSLRALDWGSRTLRRRAREISEAAASLETRLGRKPDHAEIAAEMKISLDQLETAMTQIDGLQIVGQHAAVGGEGEEVFDLIENAPSQAENPFELFVRGEQKRQLTAAVASLNEREQLILSLYYKEELTMKEVAEVVGIALSRVSQIHAAALGKLRQFMRECERLPNRVAGVHVSAPVFAAAVGEAR